MEAIADADRPEHASMLEWSGGACDPNAFNPAAVVSDQPRKRWKKAFAGALAQQVDYIVG